MLLRAETKKRARALQLLYAWELQDKPQITDVAQRLAQLSARSGRAMAAAEELAKSVVEKIGELDDEIEEATDNWRMERVGVVERNILRLALYELSQGDTPAAVVIDEAVRLAHWFAGSRAPAFINGILDNLARQHGRL